MYYPVGGFSSTECAEVLAQTPSQVQWGHGRRDGGLPLSAVLAILPLVWAYAPVLVEENEELPLEPVPAELAFYRKYTEAMLLRYFSMSMEAGRVPSLLGKEMFQGRVTNYVVHSFEDVVMADLSVLKSQMEQVMGIGQPGRLCHVEDRLLHHEQALQRMKGMMGAFGGLLTAVHLGIDYFMGRR
jgi:hypothetical protein